LDTLRCIAFACVFFDHLELTKIPALGCHGVWLFFAISGFVITRRLLRGSTGNLRHDLKVFYTRRALRILPVYYLVLTVMLFSGLLPDAAWFYCFLSNILSALRGHWVSRITAPLWSLSVEEQFYLLYPLFLLSTPPKWRGRMLILLTVSSILARIFIYHAIPNGFADQLLLVAGQYLLWGGLAAWFDLQPQSERLSSSLCIVVGLQLIGLFFISQQEPLISCIWSSACYLKIESIVPTILWTLNAIGNALVVLGFWKLKQRFWLGIFTFPVFIYIGKISYCLYLIHELCYQPLKGGLAWFPCHNDARCLGAMKWLSLALSVVLASLSWFFFEKPINNLKRLFPYKQGTAAQKTI